MNVLIVDEELPYPLDTGKRLRTYNLIRRLQENHVITYVCYGDEDSLLPDCPNIRVIPVKSPLHEQKKVSFYLDLLKNISSPNPYIVDRHYSYQMMSTVEKLVSTKPFDLIHCEWTPYTANIGNVLKKIPSVLSTHNVESQVWHHYFTSEHNFLKKQYILMQWQKIHRYEKFASQLYDQVTVVSESDRNVFCNSYFCSNVSVVPNGVDEKFYTPLHRPKKPFSMLFTGSMDWRPNQEAVKFFLESIFPRIKKRLPEATFMVVGRKPPSWLNDVAARVHGVNIIGAVNDLRPYLAENVMYVVPLRGGGGSRPDVLAALSMEMIVLSTSVGAQGLEVKDGTHVVLRDEPTAFAETAIELLTTPVNFRNLGRAGRRLVYDKYTWDQIAFKMEDVWRNAIKC